MQHNAKHFSLELGGLIALYVSITSLLTLILSTITLVFPDSELLYESTSASMNIRTAVAVLVVFFPTYIALTRVINTAKRKEDHAQAGLTKWLMYLSLLVGGVVLLVDLVIVLHNFLNGELTVRFLLKALAVIVVVGSAFVYYLLDMRGYWQKHERESKRYALTATILVLLAIVFGLLNTETPGEIRKKRVDGEQIQELMQIQDKIESQVYLTNMLPETLEDAYGELQVPSAPAERAPYTYKRLSTNEFELCAEFAFPSNPDEYGVSYVDTTRKIKNPYDWNYNAGLWCFKRAIQKQ